jgi:myo-inositol-1(or 4)-monophosphatase
MSKTPLKDFLNEIVLAAGELSLEYRARLETLKVSRKSRRDMVSEADIAIEKFLVDKILAKYPGHSILGEESGEHAGDENGEKWRWVIDPIDGTTSFVRGQPFYSISVAVEKDGEAVFGAVYAPVLGEMFTAEKGKGAYLNGKPIRVSKESRLCDCVLATGFACVRNDAEHNNLGHFVRILPEITAVRRFGSAAVDLCYVGCARLDGFWELNLNVYDVAAGMLIAKEAGAKITDFSGEPVSDYKEIVCTNALVHDEFIGLLGKK